MSVNEVKSKTEIYFHERKSEVSDKVIYEECSKFRHISQSEVILV